MTPNTTVELTHTPALTFALEQAGVPIVSSVRVANGSPTPLEGATLSIELAPDLGKPTHVRVPLVHGGESVDLGILDIQLPPGRLRGVTEAERARIQWSLRVGDALLAEGSGPIEVLPYNHWPGARAPSALLAMFVTPNHPVVAALLRHVRDRLGAATGSNALDGYQSRSPARVVAMVAALYETLQQFGVSYAEPPASFESSGQKIRLPDQILGEQLATCLDMTVLAASCLEQMGLSPLLVVLRGHAFPGVWLVDERFPEGVVEDAARLRTSAVLDQLFFFDSSAVVTSPPLPLTAARKVASDHLRGDDELAFALDVRVARMDRYRPLPLRDVAGPPPAPAAATAPAPVDASTSAAARTLLIEAAQIQATPPPPVAAPAPADPVAARLKQWRDRLLDLSLRNKLLNFRPDVKGALPLDIPDAAAFEDALAEEKVFDVLPRPADDPRDARDARLVNARSDQADLEARRREDLKRGVLHCPLSEQEARLRSVHLDRTTRTDLEEGGANTLFAAIGLLRWYESEASDVARHAPLLLVPVSLEYQRTTRRIRLRGLPEESMPNVALVEKLRERDLDVDLSALTTLESDEHGRDIPAMFRAVRQAVQRMPRWEVIEEVHLGLFAFTKFLMWRDLEDNAAAILESPVVRHIASGAQTAFPNPAPAADAGALDDTVPPARLPLVLDSDSTQMAAVVSALAGRSFVLQGPPGTGKSQTITNLIAAAIADGRTVLFVSEKMAALEVVKRRLERAGIGDFCLELHSHKAQKKQVIASLGSSLSRPVRAPSPPWEERSTELAGLRARLNAYPRALHAARPLGRSFYQGSARLLALSHAPDVPVAFAGVAAATDAQLRALLEAAESYSVAAREVDPVAAHPYRDAAVVDWSAHVEQSLRQALDGALRAVSAVDDAGRRLAAGLGVPPTGAAVGLDEMAQLGAAAAGGWLPRVLIEGASSAGIRGRIQAWTGQVRTVLEWRQRLAGRWQDSLYQSELEPLESRFKRWAESFFLFAWIFLRGARSRLKAMARGGLPENREIAADLTLARAVLGATAEVERERAALVQALEGAWTGANPEELTPVLARADAFEAARRRYQASSPVPLDPVVALTDRALSPARRSAVAEQSRALSDALGVLRGHVRGVLGVLAPPPSVWPDETAPGYLSCAHGLLSRWAQGLGGLRSFCLYQKQRVLFAQWGATPLIEAHRAGALRAGDLVACAERAFLQAWMDVIRDSEPALRGFDGPNHHRLAERFRTIDQEHLALGRLRAAASLEERLPQIDGAVSEASETGRLQRELRKKTRHMPIRRLLGELPNLSTRLKPCFLMSPLSVAQYLPAGGRRFDMVVFDEASQICTHDAIGAIARGRQVVVVGDSRQLPPTAFFQRSAAEDAPVDDNDVEELESILDEAVAAGLPQQMLGWHYRSRHETLIDFSNQHYYDGRLNVFPAARGRVADLGVEWHGVPGGIYDKNKTRTNRVEAQALVDRLVATLRATAPGERSFGVVTFSLAQQVLIQDLLDEARGRAAEVDAHFTAGVAEPVFVKNLENVQGDERDEILFSVGYGPDDTGRVWMNFGPLNRSGGERRLNVAITRARLKLRVFSTLTHDQIDLSRTSAVGSRHLKAFLRYVSERSGSAQQRPALRSGDFESNFEREVYEALTANGHVVDCQVGCGSYRLDLAVVHPEQPGVYLLGVECDGASYHAAPTARDRDRLRQEVLEGLGWRLHRVWSTDWWFHRAREIERIEGAIRSALEESTRGVIARSAVVAPPSEPLQRAAAAPPPPSSSAGSAAAHGIGTGARAQTSPGAPYVKATVAPSRLGPEAIHDSAGERDLRARMLDVLAVEAPIHVDELTRRVAAAFGAMRMTDRLRGRVLDQLGALTAAAVVRGEFVWRSDQDPEAWTTFRGPTDNGEPRAVDYAPPEEIAAAAAWVLSRSLSTTRDDLVRETARAFGIQRAGARVTERMLVGIALLVKSGRGVVEGDRVTWRDER